MIECSKCSSLNAESDQLDYCRNCGEKLPKQPMQESDSPKSDSTQNTPNQKKKITISKKRKKILGVALGIALAVILIIILFATHVLCFHDWKPATCKTPETCIICNTTREAALGHEWIEATCTQAKKCTRCGAKDGEPLGHKASEWVIDKESTCTKHGKRHGTCSVCNETVSEDMPLKEHTLGDWEIAKEATETKKGEQIKKCTTCGEVLQKKEYELSAEEVKARFIQSCKTFDFRDLARNANSLKGERIAARGKVVQVMREGSILALRVNITQGRYGIWDDTVYVTYYQKAGSPNIIEDDIITLYGEIEGTTSYKSILGATITLPDIAAEYIDIE